MGIIQNLFKKTATLKAEDNIDTNRETGFGQVLGESEDVFKAYIPEFLYKPPYGYPRKVNLSRLKMLAKTAYIFPIIKTISDQISDTPWKIQIKETHLDDGNDYTDKIREIENFFNDPNGNEQSFDSINREFVASILEIDSGVIVKVFDIDGKFKQMFVRDGATFLKNPDIYGYLGNRADFIPPQDMAEIARLNVNNKTVGFDTYQQQKNEDQLRDYYDKSILPKAAYFQYGWTAGSMPIPFGKREIVYLAQNPRYDSIYGRSPLEVIDEVIQTLVYGSQYNLSIYTNSNIPDGIIQLMGANKQQIDNFRANFESKFTKVNEFGQRVKEFFKFPISSTETKFVPFQISSKEMEVLSQQEWFTKIIWTAFGLTAEEMGFTENSNKATGETQTKLSKRKAVKPLLKSMQYAYNTQIVTEFFADEAGNIPGFGEIPVEFVWDDYDYEEDKKKHDLLEQEIRMGIKTPEQVAAELNIEFDKEHFEQKEAEEMAQKQEGFNKEKPKDKKPEVKAKIVKKKEIKEVEKTFDEELDSLADQFITEIDKIQE